MNRTPEAEFLTRQIIDAIHEEQINTYGGLRGVRGENGLESAIAAAQNIHHYGQGDIFDVARLMPTILRRANRFWMATRKLARR
jgi:death-on-curing protein